MNVYSLSLVLTLRKHVSTLRQMASSSAQMDGISSITGAATVHSGPKPRWSLQKSAMLGTTSKQDIALHRLTSDLTYSVPLTIILLLGLMTCTICIMAYDFVAPSWAVSEYVRGIACDLQRGTERCARITDPRRIHLDVSGRHRYRDDGVSYQSNPSLAVGGAFAQCCDYIAQATQRGDFRLDAQVHYRPAHSA